MPTNGVRAKTARVRTQAADHKTARKPDRDQQALWLCSRPHTSVLAGMRHVRRNCSRQQAAFCDSPFSSGAARSGHAQIREFRELSARWRLLLKMTGSGDFDNLVDLHHAGLYRFALSLARDENHAADLTQQTFYIWAAKGHQLQDRSKAKSWLYTTLHREFLAGQRRQHRFRHYELTEVSSELPSIDPALVNRLDSQTLLACLAQMDPLFRAPVALFYLEDYAYKEIADVLEVPLGTVKSRIARGLAQLQALVSEAFTGGESKGAHR